MEISNNIVSLKNDNLGTSSKREDNLRNSNDFSKIIRNAAKSKEDNASENQSRVNQSDVSDKNVDNTESKYDKVNDVGSKYKNTDKAEKSENKTEKSSGEVSFKDEKDAEEKIQNMDLNDLMLLLSQLLNESSNVDNQNTNTELANNKISLDNNGVDILKLMKDRLAALALVNKADDKNAKTQGIEGKTIESLQGLNTQNSNLLNGLANNKSTELDSLINTLKSSDLSIDNTLLKQIEAINSECNKLNKDMQVSDEAKNKILSDMVNLLQDVQSSKTGNADIVEKVQSIVKNSLKLIENDNKKLDNEGIKLGKDDELKLNQNNSLAYRNSLRTSDNNVSLTNQRNTNSEDKSASQDGGSKDAENKLLKSLTTDSKDDKFSRVTNFMTQFSDFTDNSISGVAKAVVVNRNTFTSDIIKNIKYMEMNDIKDLTVKIVPKELGEVIIKLTMDGNIMKANITATNKEAYNLLNSNLQEISNKISEQNMKIQSFSVSVSNGSMDFLNNGSNNGNSSNEQGKQGRRGGSKFDLDDEISAVSSTGFENENENVNILV